MGSGQGAFPQALVYRGKVREVYDLEAILNKSPTSANSRRLLIVTSDRISAFDVVLPTAIPDKGRVLTQLSAFWFEKTQHLMPNHLVSVLDRRWLDAETSDQPELRSRLEPLAGRAMVVTRAQRIDIECIVRGYLAGSAWAEYRHEGTVWGHRLPGGLVEGEALPTPMFTPTTKAEVGHDENMTQQQVVDMVGTELAQELEEKSLALYGCANEHARNLGIILADSKMEFGLLEEREGKEGKLVLIDELFTPDSSRFWDAAGYDPGRSLPNFDKQYVRDWLNSQGWDHEPPAPELPEDVVQKTSQRYLEAYRQLTGQELPDAGT